MAIREKNVYQKKHEFLKFGFGPSPSDIEVDNWQKANKLISTERACESFVLSFEIAGEQKYLSVTFPELGGIRISSENNGFFNPEGVTKLTYEELSEEEVRIQSENGTEIIFNEKDWSLNFIGSNSEPCFSLGSHSIEFGFSDNTLQKIRIIFDISKNEILFGLGERFNGLNQNGARHVFWNTDCGYHGDSDGLELWRSYKNVPLLHSSKEYSIFFNSFYPALSDLGYTDETLGVWEFWGPTLDLYIWFGNVRDTLIQYTDLTGKSFLPPKWACRYMSGGGNGFWYGENWGEGNIPEKYLPLLKDVTAGYKKLGTPHVAALYGEGWIANNKEAYNILEPHGTRMLNWNPPDFPIEAMRKLLPGVPDDELPRVKHALISGKDSGNYIDFFSPHVKKMLINNYKEYWELGLRGGMLDFAEMVPEYALYSNGMTGREMHNFNPYWYGKLYGEAATEVLGEDFLFYCRGGCAGSQKWCANFSGDQAAEFFGLRQQLSSALSMGTSGFSAWGGDLAGYEMKPSEEVFIRGLQFSAFQPLMRAHGTRTRCPWDFGDRAIEVYQKHYWLRENLVDKIYSSAICASKSGLPMMQAMALAFPKQRKIMAVESQYLFCDDFLVAPVLEENSSEKEVFMPEGKWYDFWSAEELSGGQKYFVSVVLETSPVYLRSGAVIPLVLGETPELSVSMLDQPLHPALLITPPEAARSTIIWEDKDTSQSYTSISGEGFFEIRCLAGSKAQALIIYSPINRAEVDGKAVMTETSDNNENIRILRNLQENWKIIRLM